MAIRRSESTAQCKVIPAHIKSKVSLIWMKKTTALYAPLSFNVLREVCQFLAYFPVLIEDRNLQFCSFNPASLQWRMVETGLSLDYQGKAACVSIGDGQFFLCGGKFVKGRSTVASRDAFLVDGSRTTHLSAMSAGRISLATYYDEASLCVFAFGGESSLRRFQRSCEQYDFRSGCWSPLPCMEKTKRGLQACGCRGKVILSGFWPALLEVFTIATKQFAPIPIPYEVMVNCQIVAWKDELIIIDGYHVQIWDMNNYTLLTEQRLKHGPCIRGPAIVWNNVLFSSCFRSCYELDLNTLHDGLSCKLPMMQEASRSHEDA